jgi:hypothetical protein
MTDRPKYGRTSRGHPVRLRWHGQSKLHDGSPTYRMQAHDGTCRLEYLEYGNTPAPVVGGRYWTIEELKEAGVRFLKRRPRSEA